MSGLFTRNRLIGLTDQDTYQGAWPIFTSSVLNMACMSAWVTGAGVVLELVRARQLGHLEDERIVHVADDQHVVGDDVPLGDDLVSEDFGLPVLFLAIHGRDYFRQVEIYLDLSISMENNHWA